MLRPFVLETLASYRARVIVVLVLMLLQSGLALAQPWFAGRFSQQLLAGQPVETLLAWWLLLLAMLLLLGWWVGVRMVAIGTGLVADGSRRLFDHLQSLPMQWHQERARGDVLSLVVADVDRLGYYFSHVVLPAVPQLVTGVGALVLMCWMEPVSGVALALLVPLAIVALRLAGRRLRPLGVASADAWAARSATAEQALMMLPVTRAMAATAHSSEGFAQRALALRDADRERFRWESLVGPVVRLVAAAAVMVVLGLASRRVAEGVLSAPELLSLLLYGLLLTQPMSHLAGVYGQTQTASGASVRLSEVLGASPEPAGGDTVLPRVRGEVQFEGVSFAYPGGRSVFEGLDLTIAAGETVALTGPNGAGKSTLVHLLLRFMDPTAGVIRLDGTDIRELVPANLRNHVGLVSQQVLLSSDTVAANIALGRPEATRAQIEAAARWARAHEFIISLPQGYDTLIGVEGARLSGGQRQRLALARTLLRNPAVLLLDEATAMFDPDAEGDFIAACHDLLAGKTVIMITHRPASLALADRVLQLRGGRLKERRK